MLESDLELVPKMNESDQCELASMDLLRETCKRPAKALSMILQGFQNNPLDEFPDLDQEVRPSSKGILQVKQFNQLSKKLECQFSILLGQQEDDMVNLFSGMECEDIEDEENEGIVEIKIILIEEMQYLVYDPGDE